LRLCRAKPACFELVEKPVVSLPAQSNVEGPALSNVEVSNLPPDILVEKRTKAGESSLLTLDAAKERLITEALQRTKGQKTAAAKILGIDRRQLNRIIDKLNIEVTQPRTG
jgi:transcriptional regulator with GAF, ATPase, and Fis domain